MRLGMVGLGKMGGNMTTRLLRDGHEVVVTDLSEEAVATAVEGGAVGADSIEGLVAQLAPPRVVWVMVPAGPATDSVLRTLGDHLDAGDLVVDGGNSNYKGTMAHGDRLAEAGIEMVDVGTSGGVWGLAEGYSMMAGGSDEAIARLRPALETLAPAADRGWGHVGPRGAGHFVKMVHNGIEYGMMQAYAEGFSLMQSKEEFGLDMHQIAQIWRHGSVIRSWLLDLAANVFEENPALDGIAAWVPDSGEGRWTVLEGIEQNLAMPVITLALQRRFRSREEEPYADRLLAALRNQFGGHAFKKSEE